MQYSPESSINIPAPYFVDQLRVIDAIRMSMPSDYQLVVKEHPEAIRTRPPHFMKSLLFKSGVVVAKFDLDTEELIKKSQLVISVTGSAAFEAFLYGKPSLVLAQTFFSDFLGGICSIDDLYTKIPNTITKKITDEMIINSLSHVYSVSSEFLARSPGPHSLTMMTYENVDLFWNAFMMHKKRQDEKS
jgi:capsule polysaccharide export protein KpsC/LpsZ